MTGTTTTAAATKDGSVPVFAYFYQWFNNSSWNRAKQDYPLAGRYSSDDAHVLRRQVQEAKASGIDGFLTSWKATDVLNRRLSLLTRVAESEDLDLGVVYQALSFTRHPLPVATVRHDMTYLLRHWGNSLTSRYYDRPVIIWTGTDLYTTADIRAVKDALGDRAYLLASSHSVDSYERVADIVDGLAYYWSSADPTRPATAAKLLAMSRAVHAHGGLWLPPVSSGYDGRLLGGTRVIGRDSGRTLVRSLDNAYGAEPDGIALISWNEWSENTYIEPGQAYGDRETAQLRDYLSARGKQMPLARVQDGPGGHPASSGWTGAWAALTLLVLSAVGLPGVALLRQRHSRRDEMPHVPAASLSRRAPALTSPGRDWTAPTPEPARRRGGSEPDHRR